MKDYTTWTDFEINRAVAEARGIDLFNSYSHSFDKKKLINKYMDKGVKWHHAPESEECFFTKVYTNPAAYLDCKFNPCNNPSDAWPIIVENRICVMASVLNDDYWLATHILEEVEFRHKNPLVAAMICYLMIKDAEK